MSGTEPTRDRSTYTHSADRRTDVGAVVIGGNFPGLGVVRSIGRQGRPVCIVDDEHSISRFSKYATHAVQVADLLDERRSVDTLLEVGYRLGLEGWVLYPTREETVAALSRHRAELAQLFRVPTPEWNSIQWAWDKRNTYRLADDLKIPAPRTWVVRALSELRAIDAQPPLIIKPAIKEHFIYATKVKAWRADTRAQLEERFLAAVALMPASEVMVQELIPGDGRQQYAYCAFFKQGCAIGSMVVRRRRQHPPEFGRASTFVETVDEPMLEALSERFLRAINYYGLVELEYKLDLRDNKFKLLDVNARPWGYHTLGFRAGVDFPYLMFCDQLGQAVAPCRAQIGMKWVRLVTDLPTGILEILSGRLTWREFAQSLTSCKIESVFCREDLLPGLADIALVPYQFVKRGY